MISKRNRVTRKEVEKVWKDGRFVRSTTFSLKYLLLGGNFTPRVAFVAPKKVAKTAVLRNKMRRQGYSAIRPFIPSLPKGFMGIFTFNLVPKEASLIPEEIKKALEKIK